MFNRQRMAGVATWFFIGAVILAVAGVYEGALLMAIAGAVFAGMYFSLAERVPISGARLHEPLPRYQFNDLMRNDPDFKTAVEFVINLPPDDFMRFARTCVEVRNKREYSVLKDFASQFRKEKGND